MFEVEAWECKHECGKRKILIGDLPQNPNPVSKNNLIFVDMHLNGAIAWGNSALDVILWGPSNPIGVCKSAFQPSLLSLTRVLGRSMGKCSLEVLYESGELTTGRLSTYTSHLSFPVLSYLPGVLVII
jgi:hypothetical protein